MGLGLAFDFKFEFNYTLQITLNDQQYQLLEQKGWLLIEVSDKVFVLDTLGGLRDVTGNDSMYLIESLY